MKVSPTMEFSVPPGNVAEAEILAQTTYFELKQNEKLDFLSWLQIAAQ